MRWDPTLWYFANYQISTVERRRQAKDSTMDKFVNLNSYPETVLKGNSNSLLDTVNLFQFYMDFNMNRDNFQMHLFCEFEFFIQIFSFLVAGVSWIYHKRSVTLTNVPNVTIVFVYLIVTSRCLVTTISFWQYMLKRSHAFLSIYKPNAKY